MRKSFAEKLIHSYKILAAKRPNRQMNLVNVNTAYILYVFGVSMSCLTKYLFIIAGNQSEQPQMRPMQTDYTNTLWCANYMLWN